MAQLQFGPDNATIWECLLPASACGEVNQGIPFVRLGRERKKEREQDDVREKRSAYMGHMYAATSWTLLQHTSLAKNYTSVAPHEQYAHRVGSRWKASATEGGNTQSAYIYMDMVEKGHTNGWELPRRDST